MTISAPVPTPVRKRQMPNITVLWAKPCSAVNTATMAMLSARVRTRPI